MIVKLKQNNISIAQQIRFVFQESYAIEAKLLNAKKFPPLQRSLNDFIDCDNDFYGFFINEELVAVTEIRQLESYTHIQSLVVLPKFFKRGIAQQLIQFTLDSYLTNEFMVETGVDNTPACSLYLKMGFQEVLQYDTSHGIRKIQFKKWH